MNTGMKYRAWHKKHQKMYEVVGWERLPPTSGSDARNDEQNRATRERFTLLASDDDRLVGVVAADVDLMESTGLCDRKNGTEIFEGDVLRASNGQVYRVYWPDGDAASYYLDRNFYQGFEFAKLEDIWHEDEELEVVGNKWEGDEISRGENTIYVPHKFAA
jgi:uncharacterized phage protein (TIGR01671 family)